MATPKKGYFLKDGTRIPGTTTVIGRFKDSGALMFWAFKQGKEGKDRLYDDVATDIGTAAHAMVEAHIKGESVINSLTDPGMAEKANSAFAAYLTWSKSFEVKIIAQEIQLVSEKYRYGGTPDAIGLVNNQLVLIDFKTSNGIYEDYLYQLAAYGQLWNENNPDRPITGGFHLCRFAKENADFAHHYYEKLDDELRGFLLMRELYDISRETKKRAA